MNTLFYLLFIFLITENIYEKFIPGINFFDEIITIVAIFKILSNIKAFQHFKLEKKIIRYLSMILLIGCLSTLIYHVQSQFGGIWRDFLAVSKFPICYFAFLPEKKYNNKNVINSKIICFSKVSITIIFIFGCINFIYPIELLTDNYRYGFPLYQFVYSHATFLISSLIILIAVLLANGLKKNLFFIILASICLILTFRSKPIIIIIFLLLALRLRKNKTQLNLSPKKIAYYIIVLTGLALYFVIDQISTYISYGDTAARTAFYIYGTDIAITYFPLGSGFCTFASTLSHTYYSPLYYEYNMQYITGITETDGSYAGDTFWPNIFAQYGIIGMIFYILMLIYVFKSINRRFNILSDKWLGAVSLFLYSVIAAFAESFYTNGSGVIYAIILTYYLGSDSKSKTQKL